MPRCDYYHVGQYDQVMRYADVGHNHAALHTNEESAIKTSWAAYTKPQRTVSVKRVHHLVSEYVYYINNHTLSRYHVQLR